MRSTNLVLFIGLLVALGLPHGAALHCNGSITTVSAGGETLYIDDRSDRTGGVNHWVYLETNGEPGLQSGGQEHHTPLFTLGDPCQHPNPDGLIII